MFGVVYAAEGSAPDVLMEVARACSPRIQVCSDREIVLDVSGLTRLFGEARAIGDQLRRLAADRGMRVRVAIAGTGTAARLMVRHRAGVMVIEPGSEATALAPLPLDVLAAIEGLDGFEDLRRWSVRTLGELAALPRDEVAARLGEAGVRWQRMAAGEDAGPLVPSVPEERFEQALDLEWPIEGLEPLSFVLGRLMEPLSAHLERRDRAAAVLHVRLHLVTRDVHARSLQLPAPMREARTLRTLALLDLESHPPPAAIDRVVVAIDPTPARTLQFSLLTRPLPLPDQIATLNARLAAVMGEDRCGSPAAVDSWQPGAFAMTPFAPVELDTNAADADATISAFVGADLPPSLRSSGVVGADLQVRPRDRAPAVAWRRFRQPVIARVVVEHGRPVRVTTDRRGLVGGQVDTCAGPWRSSGGWWQPREVWPSGPAERDAQAQHSALHWSRDEWDVLLADGAMYRLFRDERDRWFIDGVMD